VEGGVSDAIIPSSLKEGRGITQWLVLDYALAMAEDIYHRRASGGMMEYASAAPPAKYLLSAVMCGARAATKS